MKRKTGILALTALAVSALTCGIFFGCGSDLPDPPEVKDVAIAAADSSLYGQAGAMHRVTYTVPDGCAVSTSVQLGGEAATAENYTFRNDGYYFYTAGEYTVTVFAAKDGMLGQASATVSISAAGAFVDDVRIEAAAGETLGRTGSVHVVKYAAAAGSAVEVSFQKNGAETADAVYNSADSTVVFNSAGKYTVTVTATLGETEAEGTAEIEITAPASPTVTVDASSKNVRENEQVALTASAVCPEGDVVLSERFEASYRRNGSSDYAAADASTFTLNGSAFTPLVSGEWQIAYKVRTVGGATGEATVAINCRPATVTLETLTAERHRIQTNQPTEIGYLAKGAVERYDVSFDTHGNGNVTAEQGEGTSVRITAAEADFFTVTVVYTHKTNRSTKVTVDIDVYSVENLTYAPVWGEDPFGGMPDDVLSSMGHMLYFDAQFCSYTVKAGTQPLPRYALYEVTENNVTSSNRDKKDVSVLYGADENTDYPYVIVANYDLNDAGGSFTVKMTLTDPVTGYSAVAYKTFNVLATTNVNATAAKRVQDFVTGHSEFFDMGDMDYNQLCSDCRQNMVLTKTGVIMQRSNPDWALRDGGKDDADFAAIAFAAPTQNCRLEFAFRLLGANPATGAVQLGVGLCTGSGDDTWAGFFNLRSENGKLAFTNDLDTKAQKEYLSGFEMPAAERGATLFVRIDRMASGSSAEYIVSVKTEENAAYEQLARWVYNASTAAKNPGAPVAAFRLTHRNAGGCYAIENVTASDYGE